MKRGEDRHSVGAIALDLLYPDEATSLAGVTLGTPLTELTERFGPGRPDGNATEWVHPLDDPHGNDRRVVVRVHGQLGRAHRVEARLLSRDKMDVDAAWRAVKDHLDAALGKPEKEVTGVLKLVWAVPGTYAGHTVGSRYKDEQGTSVLDLALRPADGVRFERL